MQKSCRKILTTVDPRSLYSELKPEGGVSAIVGPAPTFHYFIFFWKEGRLSVFRLNCLYIQHLKYILFCCTLVSKCIKVDFTEILKKTTRFYSQWVSGVFFTETHRGSKIQYLLIYQGNIVSEQPVVIVHVLLCSLSFYLINTTKKKSCRRWKDANIA